MNSQDQSDGGMAERNKPDTASAHAGEDTGRQSYRTNMIAVLLMAAATLGSSWSAYQSSLWNGVQTFRLMDAAALSRAADKKTLAANQLRSVEASLFVEYARDVHEGRIALSEFLFARMPPELQRAIKAWIATQPMKNPQAPATPFVMPEYRVMAEDEARELKTKSDATYDEAQRANRTSDTYMMIGVLYTAALFLAGLVSGFDQRLPRRMILVLSISILIGALVIMVQQPVRRPG
ncbi:MAG TPA: hypothetical protein VI488_02755 [Candidatus Angelobacter sp.]